MTIAKHCAQRTCVGCRSCKGQDELVRYIISPTGELLVDYQHKLPGRGAYTCLDKKCVEQALSRNGFARAFKVARIDSDAECLIASLRCQLHNRVINLLGMARKAKLMSSGSQMVLDALRKPRDITAVLLAVDVSAGVGSKVRQRAQHAGVQVFECFDKATIGQALGLTERSVVALIKSPLAQTINYELQRYMYVMGDL